MTMTSTSRWDGSSARAGATSERCKGWPGRWLNCLSRFSHLQNFALSQNQRISGHVNWRRDERAHHRSVLLDPVRPAPDPSHGGGTARRSPAQPGAAPATIIIIIVYMGSWGRGGRYPIWFNSMFEFCQKMIHSTFNSILFYDRFNLKYYSIQR